MFTVIMIYHFPENHQNYERFRRCFYLLTLLKELRKVFEKESLQTNRTRLLLSAAVAATKQMAEKIYEMEYMKK